MGLAAMLLILLMGRALLMKHIVSYCRLTSCIYITNKTDRFSFKSGGAMRVAKLTYIKEDWPIVLQLEFSHKKRKD